MNAALAFLAGDRSSTTLDALEAGMRAWLDGAPAPTPAQFRLAMRDRYIRHAGYLLEAASASERAEQLAERVRTFELLRWPRWQALSELPPQADRVDALLWRARQHGALPRSWRQLFRLL